MLDVVTLLMPFVVGGIFEYLDMGLITFGLYLMVYIVVGILLLELSYYHHPKCTTTALIFILGPARETPKPPAVVEPVLSEPRPVATSHDDRRKSIDGHKAWKAEPVYIPVNYAPPQKTATDRHQRPSVLDRQDYFNKPYKVDGHDFSPYQSTTTTSPRTYPSVGGLEVFCRSRAFTD